MNKTLSHSFRFLPSPRASSQRSRAGSSVAIVVLAAAAWLSLPSVSRAQIAATVDGSGRMTFVNADSQRHHTGSTMSSPSAASLPDMQARPTDDSGDAPKPKRKAEPPPPAIPSTADSAAGSLLAPAVEEQPVDPMERIVREAAQRHQVDPALVKAVITTESGWNPRAVSRKGAMGLMQLIPGTAERYGVGDPYDPAQNVEGGTTYLKWLLDRYNGDLTKTLAAYNAGEHAVDMYGGVPWYPETRRYVQKVRQAYFQPGSGRSPTLWSAPKAPVRREVEPGGRIVFTNE
jgi:soluble lytic murein transglycosylase-like protein